MAAAIASGLPRNACPASPHLQALQERAQRDAVAAARLAVLLGRDVGDQQGTGNGGLHGEWVGIGL